jgi:hypothetical protein
VILLLIAVLLQNPAPKPRILMEPERIPLSFPEVSFGFSGFSRTDLIELVRAGRQEETSIGINSASIRNHVLQHRQKSYTLQTRSDRRGMTLTFRPADVRQEAVIVITVPQGVRVNISMDGEGIPTQNYQASLLIYEGRIDSGPHATALNALYARVDKGDLVVPVVPASNPEARIIHRDQPDLSAAELQALRKLSANGPLTVVFEATVTETGQVIELHQTSQLPVRLPGDLMRKIQESAMRFSYEPYVINGAAQAFTTTITMELPH